MSKIIDRTGKGSAITTAEHDANLSTLARKNQSITATSHTIDVDDQGEVIEYSNASPIAVTLPTIASVSGSNIHTDDFSVTLKNIGAGLVTVTRGGTDTFEGGGTSITIQRGETVTIMTDSTLAIWNILSDKNQIHYYGGASAAGTDTYAATLPRPPAAYETGRKYSFKADVANTGACTINFNSIGAASIKLQDGNDPYNGAIAASQIVDVQYDGTNMVLLNPYNTNIQLQTTVTGAAAALMEVTGLDTNYLNGYRIEVFVIGAGVSSMYIEINQDTTVTNYNGRSVTNGATATTSNTPYLGATFSAINTVSVIDVIPNATAGSITCVFQSGDVTNLHVTGLVEYAITDNITSLGISTNSGSHLGVGSYIRVIRNLNV